MKKAARTGSPRERRDPDGTRRALVEAALSLFEVHGYAATSVQRIVDDAGLTKGAFYHHFETKDDLLFEIHEEFINDQLERARRVVAEEDLAPDAMLHRLIVEALLEPLGIYRREISVFVQEYRFLEGELFDEIKSKRDEFEHCFVDVVERGMEQGVFRPLGPPRIVAFGVIGMGAWTHTWLIVGGSLAPHAIGEIYAEIVVAGLRDGSSPLGEVTAALDGTAE